MTSVWRPQIAASILTADFGHLDRVVRKLERAGVDRLHLDVMDGHFVPNLTFGPDIVAAFRRLTSLPLDVHLMISQPTRYVPRFLEAEPESITFHLEVDETDEDKVATLSAIQGAGCGPGLAVSPATPMDALRPYLDLLDAIMVMTVEPGFGGQRFMAEAAPKIGQAREWLAPAGGAVHVDGGINRDTAALAGAHGADVYVVGSALFQRGQDAADEVRLVRDGARAARLMAEGGGGVDEGQLLAFGRTAR
ncbi:MAG: ribulose-phosphate 3-epimerase [Chloroflexota bacterium]|nr:ribulose-phosphate 3-epimerase [Chloroflexota bacterium]